MVSAQYHSVRMGDSRSGGHRSAIRFPSPMILPKNVSASRSSINFDVVLEVKNLARIILELHATILDRFQSVRKVIHNRQGGGFANFMFDVVDV